MVTRHTAFYILLLTLGFELAGCLAQDDPVAACATSSDCPASLALCDEELGACTPCRLDLDCRNHAQNPYCDADSGECVQCAADEQCETRLCVDHACVTGCRDETQCDAEAPVCEAGVCVEGCRQDEHCRPEAPVCDLGEDSCVQCLVDADCSDEARPRCQGKRCVTGCSEPQHCSGDTPICDLEQEICVQCQSDAHCALPSPLCRDELCVEGCQDHDQCFGEKPFCNFQSESCVQCVHHSQCGGDSPVCKDHVCVPGCLDDADCTSPEAARCNQDFQCIPCNASVQCVGVPGRDLCASGECVECTVDDESACGEHSCDPGSRSCTQTLRGSIGVCELCIADSECGDSEGRASDEHRCIALRYMGEPQGGRCLKERADSLPECVRPYLPLISAISLSGQALTDYCGINEQLTTCEAVLAGGDGATCESGMATQCAPTGALCEPISGESFCTYPCDRDSQCPTGKPSCGPGGFCTEPSG